MFVSVHYRRLFGETRGSHTEKESAGDCPARTRRRVISPPHCTTGRPAPLLQSRSLRRMAWKTLWTKGVSCSERPEKKFVSMLKRLTFKAGGWR